MNSGMSLEEALKDQPFPLLEMAKLTDAMVSEFQSLDGPQRLLRGAHFIEFFRAVQLLSASYTKIVESRDGPRLVH